MALTTSQYATAAKKAFGDLGNQIVVIMTAVGMAESQSSGGDVAQSPGFAAGGEGAAGAFQIQNNHSESELGIPGFWSAGLWKNVDVNASAARKIYNSQGIKAWSAYTNNSYARFLPQAQEAVKNAAASAPTGSANEAGAIAWWSTIAVGGKVPAEWNTKADASRVAKSADGLYMFAGHTKADGSGYGNVSWNEGAKSQQLYVNWGTDGITSQIRPVDPGVVTPAQPFGDLSAIFGDLGPALWIGGGVILVVLGVVLLAKDTDIGSAALAVASKGMVK